MLFNSHVFLFVFLPVALLLFYGLGATGRPRIALGALFAASLFFYGWWNPAYLPVLGASILCNYGIGVGLGQPFVSPRVRFGLLTLGVSANLGALAYYKYANFAVDTYDAWLGGSFELETIVLPLAISFFTFQQIAYLVDAYRAGRGERNLLDYCVFVSFFPQLIAGPIVHHREMLPQFQRSEVVRFELANLQVGLTIFFVGLFKKVVLADGVAVYSTPVFEAAAAGEPLSLLAAWTGALAYTFQLYFDFSGYSDMAIGLGRMFGIWLPQNFESPYKAASIIDFWRRWHMTLSRFLREYLYIPLGGNRRGTARRGVNILLTMVLGGLWHGAGWTFVIWGGLHGVYLLVNHAWRAGVSSRRIGAGWPHGLRMGLATATTFLATVVAWVFFRASDLEAGVRMLAAMVGRAEHAVPDDFAISTAWLLALAAIAFLAPNVREFMTGTRPVLEVREGPPPPPYQGRLRWRPTRGWALVMAVVTIWGVLGINKLSEFLYFQF